LRLIIFKNIEVTTTKFTTEQITIQKQNPKYNTQNRQGESEVAFFNSAIHRFARSVESARNW